MSFADAKGNYREYNPWTAGSGRQGTRSIILQQVFHGFQKRFCATVYSWSSF